MRKLVAMSSVMLGACGTVDLKQNWVQPTNVPQVIIEYHSTAESVYKTCTSLGATHGPNETILACAQLSPDRCVIHFPKDPSEHMIAHELLHCSGWKH
jgi:hypothetical protein